VADIREVSVNGLIINVMPWVPSITGWRVMTRPVP
jgi:hypothetical protein